MLKLIIYLIIYNFFIVKIIFLVKFSCSKIFSKIIIFRINPIKKDEFVYNFK